MLHRYLIKDLFNNLDRKNLIMSTDHSKSYQGFGIRAIGHRYRLSTIFKELEKLQVNEYRAYCDLGCSNGYITYMVHQKFNFNMSLGLDHEVGNLAIARTSYPAIKFERIDLNIISNVHQTFDLVTCFETLEHVGDIKNAIKNLLLRIAPGGVCLISVPIEHGWRGLIKYLIKTLLFRYSLSEIRVSNKCYLKVLFSGDRLSKLRPAANNFGTHFGFDYRDVDDALVENAVEFTAYNKGMTRFYIVRVHR